MVIVTVAMWLIMATVVLIAWPRLNTQRSWRLVALALAGAFSIAHQFFFDTVTDRAHLTFRYALNLAEGRGPVFNPGEAVEGYTDFLWMVVLAMARAAFGADIETAAVVLGVLCTLGCVLLAHLLVNRILPGSPALGVGAATITAGASGLAAYGASGMAVSLFLLLVLTLCHALAGGHSVFGGVVAALATMTRPEGLGVLLVAGIWLVVVTARRRDSWWVPAGFLLGALVLLVPWTGWRATYYGHLLPNVLAAQPPGALTTGWWYVSDFLLVHQGFLLITVAGIAALVVRRSATANGTDLPRSRSLVWLVLAVALGCVLAAAYLGGDALPAWRLLAPVSPLLGVAAIGAYGVFAVSTGAPRPSPRRSAVERRVLPVLAVGLSGLSLIVSTMHPRMLPAMQYEHQRAVELGQIGDWLGDRLPSGTVISTYATGALPFHAGTDMIVVDVLGLTDEHLARQGEDQSASGYEYVVQTRRPVLAVTTASGYSDRQRCGIDPVYAGRYEIATFRREGTGQWVTVYPLSSRAPELIEALDADPRFTYVACTA